MNEGRIDTRSIRTRQPATGYSPHRSHLVSRTAWPHSALVVAAVVVAVLVVVLVLEAVVCSLVAASVSGHRCGASPARPGGARAAASSCRCGR